MKEDLWSRVLRGACSWKREEPYCWISERGNGEPVSRYDDVGFRCLRRVDNAERKV